MKEYERQIINSDEETLADFIDHIDKNYSSWRLIHIYDIDRKFKAILEREKPRPDQQWNTPQKKRKQN